MSGFNSSPALSTSTRAFTVRVFSSTVGDYELYARVGKLILRLIRPDPYLYPGRTFGVVGQSAPVRVLYSSGYNGDPGQGPVTTPGDLAEACVEIARAMTDTRVISGAIVSENLGNTSYTTGKATAIPDGARMLLEPYVDRRPV